MNIYTVKWGDKYNHQHVNNVYEACKEFYAPPDGHFDFFCLTENPKGLDKNITPLALPGGNKLVKWWNKMYLFDSNIVTQKGEKMFFDIDTIIQRDITPIANYDPEDSLCFVKTYWHDLETQFKNTRHIPHKYTDLNSSVLRWNDNLNTEEITEYFNKYKQKIKIFEI